MPPFSARGSTVAKVLVELGVAVQKLPGCFVFKPFLLEILNNLAKDLAVVFMFKAIPVLIFFFDRFCSDDFRPETQHLLPLFFNLILEFFGICNQKLTLIRNVITSKGPSSFFPNYWTRLRKEVLVDMPVA